MTTKTAYQFDAAGVFIGTTEADESPLEAGVFLLPARCTYIAPPDDLPADKWPRWNGFAWSLVNRPTTGTAEPENALAKLQAFLNAIPDVAGLLETTGGV